MIPGENITAAYGERSACEHCQVEIVQLRNGNWIHLGRHHYENHVGCIALTVATPKET